MWKQFFDGLTVWAIKYFKVSKYEEFWLKWLKTKQPLPQDLLLLLRLLVSLSLSSELEEAGDESESESDSEPELSDPDSDSATCFCCCMMSRGMFFRYSLRFSVMPPRPMEVKKLIANLVFFGLSLGKMDSSDSCIVGSWSLSLSSLIPKCSDNSCNQMQR